MDRANELIVELVNLVIELNEKTKDNWFFSFSGHIPSVSVWFMETVPAGCKSCGNDTTEQVYLSYVTSCDKITPLKELIEKTKSYLPENERQ
jgi:hypothetical protein